MEADEIERLRAYLRIKTVQPNPDYHSVASFLKNVGEDVGLIINVYEVTKGKPIIIMTLNGTDSKLPSLLLNSHTDVVPVTESKWTYDPFAAEIVDDRIYARGSQDMKSVGMGYLGAIRRLVGKGWKPKRTVHISWVPDEEIGGVDGMKKFVATKDFQNLKVGFALDEGIPSPFNSLLIFNGERIPWWVKVVAIGNAGHGSALLQGTAVERLLRVLEKVRSFRAEQMKRLAQSDNQLRDCGKFTSINITRLQAGSQTNVIPDEAIAHLDIRLSGKDTGEDDMMKLLKDWTDGEGLTFSFEQKNCFAPETSVDKDNPWWSQIHAVLMERKFEFHICTFPGATDSRYLREAGIPAIGISPFRNTPVLLHDHDEYISVNEYMEGISIYESIIQSLTG